MVYGNLCSAVLMYLTLRLDHIIFYYHPKPSFNRHPVQVESFGNTMVNEVVVKRSIIVCAVIGGIIRAACYFVCA